jgi:hypothetical protein
MTIVAACNDYPTNDASTTRFVIRAPAPSSTDSDIVMKLLDKTAEQRDQIAAGIEPDLRHCSADWAAHGGIHAFA